MVKSDLIGWEYSFGSMKTLNLLIPQARSDVRLENPPPGTTLEPSCSLRGDAKCADSRSQVPLSPFAGGQPRGPWPFCWGSEGEARAHEGKIEQSQAPRYKRGGMSGATLGLFWPEILLIRS